MTDFAGTTAIVTGASSGIGKATARELAHRGGTVVLAARRATRLDELAAEINADYPGTAHAMPTDVTDEDQVASLVEGTITECGELDVLINNAGIGRGSDVAEMETDAYREMMDVNVDGCFFATRAALPHLAEAGGHCIFVGSIAGQYPRSFNPVYAASKWWVRGFAKSVAAQYGDEGVGVTVVNPTEVRTEFETSSGDTYREHFDPGSVTEPVEVAEAIAFAASRNESAVTELDLYRRDKLSESF